MRHPCATGRAVCAGRHRSAVCRSATSAEPIYIGVSGPLTGQNARYGEQWKKGFDLALEEINGAGGIGGRPLEYIFEDSQSDPKQSVVVAQKFVADPRIIVELGDFASPASMAASPIYQRGGLVQFGFTNSHPDFTKAGGEYTWSNSVTQAQASPALADYTVTELGLDKLAVFYLNTDWGKSSFDLFSQRVEELGAEIVAAEAYLPEEKDFRSALTRARDAGPNGLVLDLLSGRRRPDRTADPAGRAGGAHRRRQFAAVAGLPEAGRRSGGRRLHSRPVPARRPAPAGQERGGQVQGQVQRDAGLLRHPRLRHHPADCPGHRDRRPDA